MCTKHIMSQPSATYCMCMTHWSLICPSYGRQALLHFFLKGFIYSFSGGGMRGSQRQLWRVRSLLPPHGTQILIYWLLLLVPSSSPLSRRQTTLGWFYSLGGHKVQFQALLHKRGKIYMIRRESRVTFPPVCRREKNDAGPMESPGSYKVVL